MENELDLFDNDELVCEYDGRLVTSSRIVAEVFGKAHRSVVRSINEKIKCAQDCAHWFFEHEYIDSRGRKQNEILMDERGCALIIMGFTGKEACIWQTKYIEAFDRMKKELSIPSKKFKGMSKAQERVIMREVGKAQRRMLTDAIKEYIPESEHKKFAYPNYTNLIYKTLFGMSTKEIRKICGIGTNRNIRDMLNASELKALSQAERTVDVLLSLGMTYDEIKEQLSKKNKTATRLECTMRLIS